MTTKNSYLVIAGITIVSFAVGFYFYPLFPAEVASHWGMNGEVNGYMPKFWGLFLLPFLMIFFSVLLFLLPKIDPLKENVASFRKYYDGVIVGMVLFLFYIHLLTLAWNIGYRFDMGKMIVPPLVFMWYLLGIALPKTKQNWFMGIRTPWTLASVRVWDETHAWSGKLFRYSAAVALIGFFLPPHLMFLFLIIPIMFSAIASAAYSYILFKKYGADNKQTINQ
ncbi:MAG: DUF1648 domain-containing protein [Candidatus Paceibacterota bacterium]|jgi:uncharacterized membrane protein